MSRLYAPVMIGALGCAILLWLGTWQMQRLEWKRGVLAEIDEKILGAAKPLPDTTITPETHRYLPVSLSGELGTGEIHVLVSVKRQGAGWRVISDFTTDTGRRVLVDRGFTPVDQKQATRYAGTAALDGNLHWPDDRNSSTPDNDPATNTWYARDIDAMAKALDTEPLLIIARTVTPKDPTLTPLPVSSAGIPNDHLQYAVTWFSLAAVWLLMTGLWITRRVSGKDI